MEKKSNQDHVSCFISNVSNSFNNVLKSLLSWRQVSFIVYDLVLLAKVSLLTNCKNYGLALASNNETLRKQKWVWVFFKIISCVNIFNYWTLSWVIMKYSFIYENLLSINEKTICWYALPFIEKDYVSNNKLVSFKT